jgi:hypothetical protein
MVVQACNPSTQDTEARGWKVQGQPEVRPCLKK